MWIIKSVFRVWNITIVWYNFKPAIIDEQITGNAYNFIDFFFVFRSSCTAIRIDSFHHFIDTEIKLSTKHKQNSPSIPDNVIHQIVTMAALKLYFTGFNGFGQFERHEKIVKSFVGEWKVILNEGAIKTKFEVTPLKIYIIVTYSTANVTLM